MKTALTAFQQQCILRQSANMRQVRNSPKSSMPLPVRNVISRRGFWFPMKSAMILWDGSCRIFRNCKFFDINLFSHLYIASKGIAAQTLRQSLFISISVKKNTTALNRRNTQRSFLCKTRCITGSNCFCKLISQTANQPFPTGNRRHPFRNGRMPLSFCKSGGEGQAFQ